MTTVAVAPMAGSVGLADLPELADHDWFELRRRARHGEDLPQAPSAPAEVLAAWIADGCPLRPGREYADYFFELDAWTEYWDLYHPESRGRFHYGADGRPGYLSALLPSPGHRRHPTFDAWKALALSAYEPEEHELAQQQFADHVRGHTDVTEAAREIDALVRSLLREHFATTDAYFDAMERFAIDSLPPIPERTALLDDHDPRKPSSGTHRLAGDVMWFAWANHLECAQLVSDEGEDERAVLMAGIAFGCSIDFAHTRRCRTRAAYAANDERAWTLMWERGKALSHDFAAAADEVRRLFYIRAYSEPT